jgi:hypothetical protein
MKGKRKEECVGVKGLDDNGRLEEGGEGTGSNALCECV